MTKLDLENLSNSAVIAIPGITYITNYINVNEQNQLLNVIDQQVWSLESVESKRRIQQHGYRYDYKNGILVSAIYLGALPDWAQSIAKRLESDRITEKAVDQLTVNEYEPGQGLRGHVDCVTCFGNTIITLSLGSSSVMKFTHSHTKENREILLLAGSLLVLQGEARYIWQHSISAYKKDIYQGKESVRTRRVSLTFREALFPHK
ncbi:MAG TPA: alpha-ketoglutarate-dependent dioxygenase AlkB [Cyanobacteria bacterium UBA8553]|nr:alpha-ketoglutarate-dependent dioxygenase AlkB [Cyanobacteria bacterium UBA8553]HAJ63159.1 alpha-ketoglutarate-dependent dioxygenase AlkB [Cyanobacteria bacterium UBA8543]